MFRRGLGSILLFAALIRSSWEIDLTVTLDNGQQLMGKSLVEDTQIAWMSIPYAKPPIGNLRFRPPVSPDPWPGVLDATSPPNACQQNPDLTFGNFSGATQWNPNTPISEDCLYLNVQREKADSAEPRCVVVWIYGGGFTTGSTVLEVYDPREFVKRDVVFVSFQYRGGSHGFLYFGSNTGAPGNVGMLDQVKVLEWVQNNIGSFGGDPNCVTLMGESSGAVSAAFHLVSPLSKGLFQRAIVQSGGINSRWGYVDPDEAYQRSANLANLVNCTVNEADLSKTIECLRGKDSSDLLAQEYSVAPYTLNLYPFVATTDGVFLDGVPKDLLGTVDEDILVLLGSNKNEGFWSLLYLMPDLFKNEELSASDKTLDLEEYASRAASIFSFYPEEVRADIIQQYENFPGPFGHFNALDAMAGDSDFICDTELLAQGLSENGNVVYRYDYLHHSSQDVWPGYTGAKHGDELEFMFGVPLVKPALYTDEEIDLAQRMMQYWTDFIKTGSPNANPNPNTVGAVQCPWPAYRPDSWRFRLLMTNDNGQSCKGGVRDFLPQCNFWFDLLDEN